MTKKRSRMVGGLRDRRIVGRTTREVDLTLTSLADVKGWTKSLTMHVALELGIKALLVEMGQDKKDKD